MCDGKEESGGRPVVIDPSHSLSASHLSLPQAEPFCSSLKSLTRSSLRSFSFTAFPPGFCSSNICITRSLTFFGLWSNFPLSEMVTLTALSKAPESPLSHPLSLVPTCSNHQTLSAFISSTVYFLPLRHQGFFLSFVLCMIVPMPKTITGMSCVSAKMCWMNM